MYGFFFLISFNNPFFICVAGVWFGFLTSLSIQSVFFSVFLWKLNWRKATEEVSVDTMTFLSI